jgi:hypothetical protein
MWIVENITVNICPFFTASSALKMMSLFKRIGKNSVNQLAKFFYSKLFRDTCSKSGTMRLPLQLPNFSLLDNKKDTKTRF